MKVVTILIQGPWTSHYLGQARKKIKKKKKRLHFLSLAAKASETNYARSIFCCCHCPSSGSLILGGQIVHINEGKDKPALFSIYLLRPPPPPPPRLTYFPFLIFLILFILPPPHWPNIDPTLTLHRPVVLTQFVCIDINLENFTPPPHFYCFYSPSPPPHFYCFHSTYMSLIADCGTKVLLSSYETTMYCS